MKKVVVKRVKSGKKKYQYRFLFKAKNGKIIGSSGTETYHNKKDCLDVLAKNFPDFQIVEQIEVIPHKRKGKLEQIEMNFEN